MKIKQTIEKFPGGMMVIPLLLGATVNTFFPKVWEIGGFTADLFTNGTTTLVALFILFAGSTIDLKQAGEPLYKGAVLTALKFIIPVTIGYLINVLVGPWGILGITPLAIIVAGTNSNGALYAALAGEFGDSTDVGAVGLLSLNDGPFLAMIAIGATGLGNIPIMAIISVIIPLIVGMILGNLDSNFRNVFAAGMGAIMPFVGFSLGTGMNLGAVVSAGLSGAILGLGVVFFTGVVIYWIYSLIRRSPQPMGVAVGTTGGNAVAVPAVIAATDPSFAPYVESATGQVAAAVVITALLIPVLAGYFSKKEKRNRDVEIEKV